MNAPLPLRSARQPGTPSVCRLDTLAGPGRYLEFRLEPGKSLLQALSEPLLEAGIIGGTVKLDGMLLSPHHFVMPAQATDGEHAAYYSEQFSIETGARCEIARATFGRRDGVPFVHCHAVWRLSDGSLQGGHILNDQAIVGEATIAQAWGLGNATMQAEFDEETRFTLFRPISDGEQPTQAASTRIAIARLKPNQDLLQGIEEACRENGFSNAIVRGSVGSIIGAEFEEGHQVTNIETEIMVQHGFVKSGADGLRAQLDIALADRYGTVSSGRLKRGHNPVLICFELVLEEVDVGHPELR
jgi:predicted DNA-binding protein with PD1-like motif